MKSPTEPDDLALRQALKQLGAAVPDSEALQQRVLAQWRLRQPQPQAGQPLLLAAGPALLLGQTRRQRLARALALLALLALGAALAAWWLRPDPALGELLQPDVLSLIAVGEL